MNARSPQKLRAGFTLIEALVALVVLSIGMLGAAGMLVDSMRTHADALRRVAAVSLLRDMADRVRANSSGRQAYDTHSAPLGTACDGGAACSPAERATADRIHFLTAAARISSRVATVRYEPAIGPATLDRFEISLDLGRDPSEPDVLSTSVAQMPVAGGA